MVLFVIIAVARVRALVVVVIVVLLRGYDEEVERALEQLGVRAVWWAQLLVVWKGERRPLDGVHADGARLAALEATSGGRLAADRGGVAGTEAVERDIDQGKHATTLFRRGNRTLEVGDAFALRRLLRAKKRFMIPVLRLRERRKPQSTWTMRLGQRGASIRTRNDHIRKKPRVM